MTFDFLLGIAGICGGAIASVAGFGIGSVVTPILATHVATKVAVAVVSIPHACGTALRFWTMRHDIDRAVFRSFGITSAAGGLIGALLHTVIQSKVLADFLGLLLIFAALLELSGVGSRLRFGRRIAWIAGALSGVFGGLVGNQGGIRSAAMLGLNVPKQSFVATTTAIALLVDCGRVPVYLVAEWKSLAHAGPTVLLLIITVAAGTVLGWHVLGRIPQKMFRKSVALLILVLGISMFVLPNK
jgi:uncharacterized membrane protein YfcA